MPDEARLSVRCPNCGKRYNVAESQSGRNVRCRGCQKEFDIGANVIATVEFGPDETQGSDETPPSRQPSRPPLVAARIEQTQPTSLGRFAIHERIGAGGFGTVYRAFDATLDREVALKVPRPEIAENEHHSQRFLREGKASAGLRHPNIVPVYDAGREGSWLYIASAYIDGEPLDQVIDRKNDIGRTVDLQLAVDIVIQLADALHYAHEQRVVHRDIKPHNVMLDADERPHLMDFGLARLQDAQDDLTRDGSKLGTPAYMSPEQASGEKVATVGAASDQYNLGVLLYELLSGRRPFSGPVEVVIYKVLKEEPEPLSGEGSGKRIPLDLNTICLKAMAKTPAGRYADCRALADDLRRWQRDEPITARPIGGLERLLRWSRRNRPLATAIGLAVVVLILGTCVSAFFAIQASRKARESRTAEKRAEKKSREYEQLATRLSERNSALSKAEKARQAALKKAETSKGQAKASSAKAEKSAGEVADAQKKLEGKIAEWKAAKEAAEFAQKKAEFLAKRSVTEQARTRKYLYLAHMNLAQQAFDQEKFIQALDLLKRHIPIDHPSRRDHVDHRAFEWYYMKSRTGALRLSREIEFAFLPTQLSVSPNGKLAVTASQSKPYIGVWNLSGQKPALLCSRPYGLGVTELDVRWTADSQRVAIQYEYKNIRRRMTEILRTSDFTAPRANTEDFGTKIRP